MDLLVILLVVLLVVGLLPTWPYSQNWGYGYWPSSVLTIVLVILLIMLLTHTRF